MVQFRPYNPRALGKVEWCHRVLRNKISFGMVNQTLSANTCVNNLTNYMKCFINEKREEVGWQFPFEVYFGRKSNELVRCSLPENRGSPEARKVSKPARNDFNRFKSSTL